MYTPHIYFKFLKQVARMPRLRHFMFRQVFEKAYERHLRAIFKTWRGIWEASERFISLRRHMRETSERFISLRTHLRDIWETYIKSIMFSYICLTLPIKSVVFFTCLTILLIRNIGFSTYCKKTSQKCCVFDTWSADVSVFTRVIFWKRAPSQLHCSLS